MVYNKKLDKYAEYIEKDIRASSSIALLIRREEKTLNRCMVLAEDAIIAGDLRNDSMPLILQNACQLNVTRRKFWVPLGDL